MKKATLLVWLSILSITGFATTHVVDTDESGSTPNNGTLTLEMALNNSVDGDTILIEFSGILELTNTLTIDVGVNIIGPAPINFAIDASNVTVGSAISVNAAGSSLKFENITFQNYSAAGNMIHVAVIGALDFYHCQFTNNANTFGGGGAVALDAGASANFESCSFYANQANGFGGAIFKTGPGAPVNFNNCSFLNNNADQGGAAYLDGDAVFTFCTFYGNSATLGGAIFIDSGSTDVSLGSCFFDPTNSSNVFDGPSVVNSLGNNLLNDDAGASGAFGAAGDLVGAGYTFGLRSAGPIKDGYGLWWIPITDPASDARNSGGVSGQPKDGRRAPRELEGASDIGAIEYTPYTVTDNGTSPSVPGTFAYALQQSAIDGAMPAYIDFRIGQSAVISSPGITYEIQIAPTIIDGFTQPGSRVPGPRNFSTPAKTGTIPVIIDGAGSYSITGIGIANGLNDNRISGIGIVGYETGIDIDSEWNVIFGCHFGTNDDASDASNYVIHGINSNGASSFNVIGGEKPFERNTFGGCQTSGIVLPGAANNHIIGNFFGVPGDGEGTYANAGMGIGVWVNGAISTRIEGNVFGHCNNAIVVANGDQEEIISNIIGLDPEGLLPMAVNNIGLNLASGNVSVTDNIIGNCSGTAGIYASNVSSLNITGNLIGINRVGTVAQPNADGIYFFNATNSIIEDNTISGNTSSGVYLAGSSNIQILSNLMGLDPLGTSGLSLGNNTGITLDNSFSNTIGSMSMPNYISDNNDIGISLVGSSSSSNSIDGNWIGWETDNATPAGNGTNGVSLFSSANSNSVGAIGGGNSIGNNGLHGVYIGGDSDTNRVFGNSIHGNSVVGVYIDGATSEQNSISTNDISENGGLGIELFSGANQSIQRPEIIGASDCSTGTNVRVKLSGLVVGNTYVLEFFMIPGGNQDGSGFGEGDNFIESIPVTASLAGVEEFTVNLTSVISPPDLISVTVTDQNNNTSEFSNHFAVNPAPQVSLASITNESCAGSNDGAIDMNVSGGSGNLSFTWFDNSLAPIGQNNQDAIGLPSDDYFLVVMDTAGCQVTSAVYTVSFGIFSLTTVATDVSCAGSADGVIDFEAIGGSGSYDFSIDGGATFIAFGNSGIFSASPMPSGTYDPLAVDTLTGCIATASPVVIGQPSPLSVTFSVNDESCNGLADGTIDASPSGGTGGYSSDWYSNAALTNFIASADTLTNLVPGIYYYQVTDGNGCTFSTEDTVNGFPAIAFDVPITGDPICDGSCDGEITMGAAGGAGSFSYQWYDSGSFPLSGQNNPLVTGLCAGDYYLEAIDLNGCQQISSLVTLLSPSPISVSGAVASNYNGQDISCFAATDGEITVSFSGGIPPYDISLDGGLSFVATSVSGSSYVITGLGDGVYNPYLIDANGCVKSGASVSLIQPLQLLSSETSTDETCFGANDGTITLTVVDGTPPYTYNWYFDVNYTSLAFSNASGSASDIQTGVSPAMYFPEVIDANGCMHYTGSAVVNTGVVISASIAGTDVLCFGNTTGAADLTVSGGTAPYSYSWSNGATIEDLSGLAAGTYNVTITDVNGCSTTASVTITEPAAGLAASIAGTDVLCFGNTTGAADLTVSGGTAPYTYSWSNGAITEDLSGLAAGTYNVTITDANGCSTTASVTITEPAAGLSASIAGTNVLCFGNTTGGADLTVSGGTSPYTYSWSNGSTTEDLSGLAAGTYNVTITDANGCSTTASVTITEPAAVLTASIAGTDVSCLGLIDGSASVTPTGGSAPYNVQWYDDAALNSNIGSGNSVSGIAAGWYYVVITDQAGTGCVALDSVQIMSPSALLYSSATLTDPTCSGNSDGSITANISGGIPPYEYSTNGVAYFPGTTISGLPDGNYQVYIRDANGCEIGPFLETLAGPVPPFVNVGSDSGVCVNLSFSLAASFSNTTNFLWTTTGGGVFTPNNTDPNAVYVPAQSDANSVITITASASGNGSCPSAVDDLLLTVEALPDPGSDWSLSMCADTASFDLYNEIPGTPNPMGIWSPLLFGGTNLFDPLDDGTGAYYYVVSGTYCGADSSLANLTVITVPSATISPAGPFCETDPVQTLSAATNGGTWSGTGITNSVSGEFDPSIAGGGVFTITYTISGACPSSGSEMITVNPYLDPTVTTPADTLCWYDSPISLSAATSGGTWSGTGITSTALGIFDPAVTGNGDFTITYTTLGGCGGSDTETFTVSKPTVSAQVNDITCNGAADELVWITAGAGVGAPFEFYQNGNGPASGSNPVGFSGSGPGTYLYNVRDAAGCSSDTITVQLTDPPALSFTIQISADTCGLGVGSIGAALSGGVSPYNYSLNGAGPQVSGVFSQLTTNGYLLTGLDANGCQIDTNIIIDNVTLLPDDFINAGPDGLVICPEQTVQLFANPGGTAYNWTGGIFNDPAISNPTVAPADDTNTYILSMSFGVCNGTDTVIIYVDPTGCELAETVNNAFSPGNDNVNDTWIIRDIGNSPKNKVYIYNRWGDLIHEFIDYDNFSVVWNGTDRRGEELPGGTYYYVIEYTELGKTKSGWVYISK